MVDLTSTDLIPCDARNFMAIQGKATAYSAIYYPFVVWVLGVLIFFLLRRIPKLSVFPYAAVMFLLGTAMGMGAEMDDSDNLLNVSIRQWVRIDGHLLLLVFLPGLIFRDAIEVDWDLFICSLSQLLVLAFPMVLVGTGLVAAVCVYTLPSYYNFSWSLGATLGAILSSTDPVAVAAVLKEAGAPPRLQMHILGESMLNDGSALVFYNIFSQVYLSSLSREEALGWTEGIILFIQYSFGGLAMGIAFALGLVLVLGELDRRLDAEYNVLQVVTAISAAYTSFFTAEHFKMSGIIACVVCGIGGARLGRGLINDAHLMDSYLELMEHMLKSLMFALGGSIWGGVLFSSRTAYIGPDDWAHCIAFFLLVLLIRFFQVGLFYPILCRIGLKTNVKEAIFMGFGGLRGAVGIALAASLFLNVMRHTCHRNSSFDEDATRLVFLSGAITLGTLMINGTATGWVLRRLGLALPSKGTTKNDVFDARLREFANQEIQKLVNQKRFSEFVDYEIVRAHVPFLTRKPAENSTDDESTASSAFGTHASQASLQHRSSIARIASDRDSPVNQKVVQLRFLFLDMLKEIYDRARDSGELVLEGGNRALDVSAYRHSVEFAEADAKHTPMSDWKALQMFSTTQEDAITIIRHGFQRLESLDPRQVQKHDIAEYKRKRGKLLRAFCFILAHERAQKRLETYVKSVIDDSDALQKAQKTIIDESKAEVEEAKAVIDSIPDDDQEIILSHYAATIILNRLISLIEESSRDGHLPPDEARAYLDKIEHECQPNHHIDGYVCDCLIKHSQRLEEGAESLETGLVASAD